VHLEPRADPVGQNVGDQEAQVVPGGGVLRARVAQADHQQRLGHEGSALPD
jgi:hypothetical protein